jgi:hypothetical protein
MIDFGRAGATFVTVRLTDDALARVDQLVEATLVSSNRRGHPEPERTFRAAEFAYGRKSANSRNSYAR